jgi:hypothetical protein
MPTSSTGDAGPTQLTCPACGGAIDLASLDQVSASGRPWVECTYCGSTVALPQ